MKLKGKDFILGFQHLFAMFGATVLVPVLTGLSVSATLLFAGIGTLLFHILTGRKVPVFLGSSFAFLGGYFAIAELCQNSGIDNFSAYAGVGVACAGLVYVVIAILFKVFGAGRVMKFFPPVVTGPIIIAIGLTLSSSAISNCSSNWIIALVAIAVVIICNIWGKGMVKIIPILLGVVASYVVGICMGQVDFTAVKEAAWIGLPVASINETAFSLFKNCNTSVLITSILTIMPISLATIIEHIGDVSAVSSTVGENFIAKPGLHRTLLGDGLATTLAALFGAPANTTYGENTGVLALTKVYDPKVIRLAAIFAVILSFSPKFAAIVSAMPAATMGGISLVLYGMISAVGVRNVVENQVDFSKSRNIIIAALILVLAIGVKFGTGDAEAVVFQISQVTISLSGIAVAAIIGILLNAVLPGKDYVFKEDENKGTNTGVSFKV
ncbi:MAG: uracil-xanthine permease family protein [Clostridia bacterium]|nr:uracil-xanthine permease family protein [Clostridia bacterium]